MGQVLFAGKEAQEGAALQSGVVTDGSAEHGVAGLEGVEGRLQGDRPFDVESNLAANVSQRAKVRGEDDADHSVCSSIGYRVAVVSLGGVGSAVPPGLEIPGWILPRAYARGFTMASLRDLVECGLVCSTKSPGYFRIPLRGLRPSYFKAMPILPVGRRRYFHAMVC